MNQLKYNYCSRQIGAAALLVTVMLALIAGVATIYVNRGGLLLQKSVANNSQNVMAAQAAEAGMNAFIAQLQIDIAKLDSNPADTTTTLISAAPTGGASSCAPGSASFPYVFKSPYADATATPANTRFLPTQFFSESINLINSITNVTPDLSYQVQAAIIGNMMYIRSNGLASDTDASSIVRKSIQIKGGFDVGGAGISVGGYVDHNGALEVKQLTSIEPAPICSVIYGDTYSKDPLVIPAPVYKCSNGLPPIGGNYGAVDCVPVATPSLGTNLFERIFKMSKAEMALKADSITTGCPPEVSKNDQIYIINGDITAPCRVLGSNNLIILNGDVTTGGQFYQTNGLLYVNNIYQNGSIAMVGSIVVEGSWDRGALASMLPEAGGAPFINSKDDAIGADVKRKGTHSGFGSFDVFYKKYKQPPSSIDDRLLISTSSWIDF